MEESSATLPFVLAAVRDQVGDEYIIVTPDGLEVKRLSWNSRYFIALLFYIYIGLVLSVLLHADSMLVASSVY